MDNIFTALLKYPHTNYSVDGSFFFSNPGRAARYYLSLSCVKFPPMKSIKISWRAKPEKKNLRQLSTTTTTNSTLGFLSSLQPVLTNGEKKIIIHKSRYSYSKNAETQTLRLHGHRPVAKPTPEPKPQAPNRPTKAKVRFRCYHALARTQGSPGIRKTKAWSTAENSQGADGECEAQCEPGGDGEED